MGEIKLGDNSVGKMFLGNTKLGGGLEINYEENVFNDYAAVALGITFINNCNKEIEVKIENVHDGQVIAGVEVTIPAKSILIRPSYPIELGNAGNQFARLTILTNAKHTSYAYIYTDPSSANNARHIKALNVLDLVHNNRNVFDYRSSYRYGYSFSGTFLFND